MPNDPLSLEKCRALLNDAKCPPGDDEELAAIHGQVLLLSEAVVQTYEHFRDGVQDFDAQAILSAGSRGFWKLLGYEPDEMQDEIDAISYEYDDALDTEGAEE